MSNGMMMMSAELIGFIIGILVTAETHYNPLYAIGNFLFLIGVAVILSFFIKEDLRL